MISPHPGMDLVPATHDARRLEHRTTASTARSDRRNKGARRALRAGSGRRRAAHRRPDSLDLRWGVAVPFKFDVTEEDSREADPEVASLVAGSLSMASSPLVGLDVSGARETAREQHHARLLTEVTGLRIDEAPADSRPTCGSAGRSARR
jgi:hypothetical protein